jgi:hypothetical protein
MSQTFTLELGDKGGSHHFTSASALKDWVHEENSKALSGSKRPILPT